MQDALNSLYWHLKTISFSDFRFLSSKAWSLITSKTANYTTDYVLRTACDWCQLIIPLTARLTNSLSTYGQDHTPTQWNCERPNPTVSQVFRLSSIHQTIEISFLSSRVTAKRCKKLLPCKTRDELKLRNPLCWPFKDWFLISSFFTCSLINSTTLLVFSYRG